MTFSSSEVLATFFADFGVSVTANGVTGLGILDMPTETLLGDQVLSTDYTLTARASEFGSLKYGDAVTIDGVAYTVRENRLLDDGKLTEVSLSRNS
jgi:hypothetical protein